MRTEGNALPSEEKQSYLKHAEKKGGINGKVRPVKAF